MAFYVQTIAGVCFERGCEKLSTHAVHTSGTAVYVRGCKRHCAAYAKRRNAEESKKVKEDN